MLSDAVKKEIAAHLAAAPHGDRVAAAERLAQRYGVSRATIYRVAKRGGTPRERQPERPEYRDWTRIAVALAHSPDVGEPLPLDLAIEAGIDSGDLPPEAADMPIPTAYRLARQIGLTKQRRRSHRLDADYPMQAVLIDYSTSKFLLADREDGDDWILRLHRRPVPASGYKNRPLREHRKRVGVYALWDMCTGCVVARYVVSSGENALDALDFLCWALAQDKDPRLVLHGVPDDLWSDLGPLARSDAAADLLERLNIALVTGKPYAKERMGGVEVSHKTRWRRFERALFLRGSDTIRLSALNDRLTEFMVRENARPARTKVDGRHRSRAAAWMELTNRRPADNPLCKLPPNAMQTLVREERRKLDVNGIIRWDNVEYECADWHDRWVIARRAIDGSGDLAIEDEATGEKRLARRYERRPYGTIRQSPASPLEQLLGDKAGRKANADIYAPKTATGAANVTQLPPRSAAAAPLENPLSGGDRCRDLDEAMRLFTSIYQWPLSAANRALVIERITEAGLSRQAVTALAQELRALAHKQA